MSEPQHGSDPTASETAVDARAAAPATGRIQLPPTLTILLSLAAAVIVLGGMYLGRSLIGPLALGAVLVIICHPVRRPLERIGLPRWLATTAVIVVGYAVLIAMALMLAFAAAEFTSLVIDYTPDIRATVDLVVDWLAQTGLDARVSEAATSILSPSNVISVVTQFGSGTLGVLTALFFIFAYVIFMAADGARYRRATDEFGAAAAPAMGRFEAFNRSVRRYFVVNALFGLIVAVIDGVALAFMGVPAPLVWAILAFVTNFIPNIGFVLGLVPPAVFALAVGGWQLMLGVIVVYCVVNVVLQVLVQPKFVSDAVNLSLTLSFFSVLFWTFVIGPLGAILSIPLTLAVRALLLEVDPRHRWLRWLSGDSTAAERSA